MNNSNVLSYWRIKDVPKEQLKDRDEIKFKQGVNKIIILIKNALTTHENFSVAAYPFFDEIFQLRLKGLELAKKNQLTWIELHDKLSASFENKDNILEYEELIENVLFGIRVLKKVAIKVVDDDINPFEQLDLSALNDIPLISYETFLNIFKMALSLVPVKYRANAFNLFHSSLMLETALMAADIYLDNFERLNISKQKYSELNEILVKNAQLYGASARGLGIIGNKKKKRKIIENDNIAFSEEIELAEMGLENYLNQIDNE